MKYQEELIQRAVNGMHAFVRIGTDEVENVDREKFPITFEAYEGMAKSTLRSITELPEERDFQAMRFDSKSGRILQEPQAHKRMCFRAGWDAAIKALKDVGET